MKVTKQPQTTPLPQNNVQSNPVGKYSTWVPCIARAVEKYALPAITLFALSSLPAAEAGPMAFTACTTLCLGFASPILAPACITSCLPLLYAPTP